jgi:hypothetical protein
MMFSNETYGSPDAGTTNKIMFSAPRRSWDLPSEEMIASKEITIP